MKIRIEVSSLASRQISGVGNYTKLLAEALQAHSTADIDAVYFNFLQRQPKPQLVVKNLQANIFFPLRIYAKLQSFNLAPPFDIFKSKTDILLYPNFATWPSVKSKHTATVVHDLTYLHYPEVMEPKNLAHLRRVVKRSVEKADTIITVSEAVKQEILATFGIDGEKCVVTPIPPDPKYYTPNGNDVHTKYHIPTKKYLYFVGNLEPRKDIPTLVKAYQLLPKEMKDEYSLVLGGGRGWKTEASDQAIADAQKRGENVLHIGYVDGDDAADMYHNASLFVMASLYEGFGMPLLEAMAAGCPVVCSDIPVLRETAGDAVLYAAVQSPEDFSHQIQSVLVSTNLSKSLIEQGSRRVQEFSWDDNARMLVQYFEKTSTK